MTTPSLSVTSKSKQLDQDADLTVCYAMNRMEGGLTGDLRGASIVLAAVVGLAGG